MRTIVLSTCASRREASKIGQELVKRRLAACVNVYPVMSIYRWKGKITTGPEYLMIIKTRSEVFASLRRRILALHSYEVPEIISLRIEKGHEPYLRWIDEEVNSRKLKK